MCSENDKIIFLSHFSKVHANEVHLEIAFLNLTPPKLKLIRKLYFCCDLNFNAFNTCLY